MTSNWLPLHVVAWLSVALLLLPTVMLIMSQKDNNFETNFKHKKGFGMEGNLDVFATNA